MFKIVLSLLFISTAFAQEISPVESGRLIESAKINEIIAKINEAKSDIAQLQAAKVNKPIKVVFQDRTDNISLTAIPKDDTIPQITEGTEIFNISYTPKKAGNELLIEVQASGSETSNADDAFVVAVFLNNQNNAIVSGLDSLNTLNTFLQGGNVHLSKKVITTAGTMSIMVRAGIATGVLNRVWTFATNVRPNFGSTTNSWIKVTEIEK